MGNRQISVAFSLVLFFFCACASANNWKVEFLKGKAASYVKKEKTFLKVGDEVHEGQAVLTANSSLVKLKHSNGTQVVVGPSSQLALPKKKAKKTSIIYLVKGKLRYIGALDEKEAPQVRTKTVSTAIRGTDFMLVSTPFLGESEIVLFEGKVRFLNLADSKDFQDLKPGQWGGHGGRFGSTIKKPIDLPASVLDTFKAQFLVK